MKTLDDNRGILNRYGASILLGAAVVGCAQPRQQPPAPVPAPVVIAELPPIPVEMIAADSLPASAPIGGRITLTSINADLRDLLPLLASAAESGHDCPVSMRKHKRGHDLAARIYRQLTGEPDMDDAERWQHALFFAMSPQERCHFSLKTARSALSLKRFAKKK